MSWRLAPFKSAIDAMLFEDTAAPRKQRHTARRLLARLIEEHGSEDLSYSTVRDDVRVRRETSLMFSRDVAIYYADNVLAAFPGAF